MTENFVPLTDGRMFKAFFSHKEMLKMFLEDTLEIKIKKLVYQDSLPENDCKNNKGYRLDVIILLDDNSYNYISLNMQNEEDEDIIYKSHYYLNRIITGSLTEDERYDKLKKFIALNILNYNDERFKKLYHVCKFCNVETNEVLSDLEEIHIISLKSQEIDK